MNIFGLWHLLQCLQTSITNWHTHANKYFYCLRSLFRTKRVHSNPVAIVLADDTPSRTSNPHYDNTDPATTSGITTTLKPTSTSTAPRATSAKPCMSLHFLSPSFMHRFSFALFNARYDFNSVATDFISYTFSTLANPDSGNITATKETTLAATTTYEGMCKCINVGTGASYSNHNCGDVYYSNTRVASEICDWYPPSHAVKNALSL